MVSATPPARPQGPEIQARLMPLGDARHKAPEGATVTPSPASQVEARDGGAARAGWMIQIGAADNLAKANDLLIRPTAQNRSTGVQSSLPSNIGSSAVMSVSTAPGDTSNAFSGVPSKATVRCSTSRVWPAFATPYAESYGADRSPKPSPRFTQARLYTWFGAFDLNVDSSRGCDDSKFHAIPIPLC